MTFVPQFTNLVTMLDRSLSRYGDRPIFGIKRHGAWKWITYREFGALVDACRAGMAQLGVERGDRVAIISNNRLEWAVGAFAAYGRAAAWVPMYEAQLDKDWKFILDDCAAKVVFAATTVIAERVRAFAPQLTVVDLERDWDALLAKGRAAPVTATNPADEDIADYIYTSGTTGNPKGVKLSHFNIAANTSSLLEMFPLSPSDRSFAFLPWAHVAGGCTELLAMIANGASSAICEKVEELVASLPEVQPTVLIAVPRVWNKIYDGVNKTMADKPKIVQYIFREGLRIRAKEKRGEHLHKRERAIVFVAERLFAKVRARFGGKLRYALSGAAALSKDVGEFIDNLGIEVYEGYGMTESASVVVANRPGARRIGSVGKAMPGVTIKLDTEAAGASDGSGEILLYGPGTMVGYHNLPEETERTLTADGGLRSGDVGRFDSDGFLFITGRVKEIYKLETGKYVSPAPLEEAITLSPFITQAMVHGMNKPFNVALLVVDVGAIVTWAEREGIALSSAEIATHGKVQELLRKELAKASEGWRGYERVESFVVLTEEFSMQNDMLTPTLKLKRRNVMAKHEPALEALYTARAKSKSKERAA